MLKLRGYQNEIIERTRSSFSAGKRAPLIVSPTGSGKTVMFSYFASSAVKKQNRVLVLAHRQELLDQISDTLREFGVFHSFIAPGRNYTAKSPVHVASVFSVIRRLNRMPKPDFIIIDEAAHAIKGSTWSKVLDAFPNAWRIGVTATPMRLSGEGLDDIFDDLIIGPSVESLIEQGSLSRYRIFAPSVIQTENVHMRGGDFVKSELEAAADKPSITGNAIAEYKKRADGKRAICFCVSVEHAKHVAEEFRAAGYRAQSIDGKLDRGIRKTIITEYKEGKIDVLTSCDLVSEGFDLPAIEVAVMLRPTASLALWLQQAGRALRPYPGKDHAIILDHAGNCQRHGLPCDSREWSLNGNQARRSGASNGVSVRICSKCFAANRSVSTVCEYCGAVFEIKPRQVEVKEGELSELNLDEIKRSKRLEQGRCQSFDDLVALAKLRKYKRPYLYAKYVWNARQAKKLARAS